MGWSPFVSKPNVSPNTIVSLTQEGRNKAESQEGSGGLGAILATLQFGGSNSSYSISELSERTGLPEKSVSDIVRTNRAYIMVKTSAE
jgi:hypothetical protein